MYKTILKPIWTYGIQLWGTASTSNIEILDISGWILERWDGVMWTGLVWLRIGTGGELL
jgi:hypothetical protein